MDYGLTDEQRMVRDTAREIATREFTDELSLRCDREEAFPEDAWRAIAKAGFVGAVIPEAYGGAGLDVLDYALVMEQFCRVDPGLGVACLATTLGSEVVQELGTEAQKERLLPPLCRAEAISAAAITEPGAGSDVAGTRTRATRNGDDWVLDGSKMFITNGTLADWMVVLAVTDPDADDRHRRHSTFIVEADRDGVEATKIHGKMGIRASDTAEVRLDGVRVPDENLVGERGMGFYQVMMFFNATRLGVAAQSVGLAQGALDLATDYALQREAFGRPIGGFQAIQLKLAEMATRTEAARRLTYKGAWHLDRGAPDPVASSMAKWYAARTAVEVADEAVQVHGGYGYVDESRVERFYRAAKVTELYEGTREIHQLIIARRLLGLV